MEHNGTIPPCENHRHMSRGKAEEIIAERFIFLSDQGNFVRFVEAKWVGKGKKFMSFVRHREWRRLPSAGTTVMQLIG